jgi:cytochrome c biogenesis protein ResB
MGDSTKADTPEEKGVAAQIWSLLGSIKFAVGILLLIAAASAWGTTMEMSEAYDRIWSTVWYRALLGIILLSAVVCTVDRFDGVLRRVREPKVEVSRKVMGSLKGHRKKRVESDPALAADALEAHFRERRFDVRRVESDSGEISLLARKGVSKLFGAAIVHVSLVILIVATIWGVSPSFGSYRQNMQVREGEFAWERRSNIWVGCDDFEIIYSEEDIDEPQHEGVDTYYKVSDYISDVIFYEPVPLSEAEIVVEMIDQTAEWPAPLGVEAARDDGGPIASRGGELVGLRKLSDSVVKVNQPAHVRDIDYFQSAYDLDAVRVTVTNDRGVTESHDIQLQDAMDPSIMGLPPRRTVPLLIEAPEPPGEDEDTADDAMDQGLMVTVTGMVQRYEDGMALPAGSMMTPDPAVQVAQITVDEQGRVEGIPIGWVEQGETVAIGEGQLTFDEPIYYTILEVRHQPGVWLLMVGFAIAGVGLVLAFWVPFREIRAKVVPGRDGDTVEAMAGLPRSYRGDDAGEITAAAMKALPE